MKIKTIRRTDPELYLVTYSRRWRSDVERWVIQADRKRKIHGCTITDYYPFIFYFRDTGELALDCWHQIEWMIRNEIEFFDNTKSPDTVWPRGDRHQLCENCGKRHDLSDWCTSDKFLSKSNVPNIRNIPPIPDKKSQIPTADEHWIIFCDNNPVKRDMTKYGAECQQNGRLERGLELQPFFKAFLKYRANDGVILSDLVKIFDNLPPLEKT